MGRLLGLLLLRQLQRQGAAGGSSCEVSAGLRGRVRVPWRPDAITRSSLRTVGHRLPEVKPVNTPDRERLLVALQ